MTLYMLDTDTMVFLIRARKARAAPDVRRRADEIVNSIRAAQALGDSVAISAITRAELEYGAAKSMRPVRERAALDLVLAPFEEFPFDAGTCARDYGTVRATLEAAGMAIGAMDLLIAAHALALKATLVTSNQRHFGRVDGLHVADWSSK
jgi:tRNA(fMet)-specific endonuclease VapC